MAWVKTISPDMSSGKLQEVYQKAEKRAGKVPNITLLQSLRPQTLDKGFELYCQIMDDPTGLSKRERVLIATVVSQVNGCIYWMESHEKDLRSVVESEKQREAVQTDYRNADLTTKEIALLDFAVKLTKSPISMRKEDLAPLRILGYQDDQIVDAVHCIGYFNFINRVLDGLGVDPEESMRYGKK